MKKVLLVVVLAAFLGCATFRGPAFVPQQTPIDCAMAALAMAAGTTYDRVDHARQRLGVHLEDYGGTPVPDLIAIAGNLGIRLVPHDQVNFAVDEGIIVVVLKPQAGDDSAEGGVHAVYLRRALVYDPGDRAPAPWSDKFPKWERLVVFLQKR